MEKRIFLRLFSLVLAVLLMLPMLPVSVEALTRSQVDAMDDAPVFLLQFENEDSYIQSTAFLLYDNENTQRTYLMTTDTSTYLLDEGYTPTLYGPNYCEEPVYLASEGDFAFYYAPGMSEFEPLMSAPDYKYDVIVATPDINGNYIEGVEAELVDPEGWNSDGRGLITSDQKATSSLQFGAPVFCESYGGVFGCGVSANNGHFGISHFYYIDFPEYASIDYLEEILFGETSSNSSSNSNIVTGKYSDEKFYRSGGAYCHPFVFDNALKRCSGFTLDYEITEIEKGKFDGNWKHGVYVHTTSGSWKCVGEFTMRELAVREQIRFDPVSIDAVGIIGWKGDGSKYYSSMTISNPILN